MEQFLRYRIKRKIDSGGMATVYLAEDESLHRDVALKMIHPHLMDRPDAVRRFENEARVIASLSHENIIKLFDYGQDEGKRYLVMEFVDGWTLLEVLERNGPLPNLVLLDVFSQIFSGLEAAHESGVCHRDMKPGNIMVDRHGAVRIMDFGIAHLIDREAMTMTGTLIGSPNYISPEQAQGKRAGPKSDVFSTGSVMYQCATDTLPFTGENPHSVIFSIANDTPSPPGKHNGRVLDAVVGLIDQCHEKDPAKRPDAPQCVEAIARMCRSYGFQLGRNRVARFLREPAVCSREDHEEVGRLLLEKGKGEFRRRNYVFALRCVSHSRIFTDLRPEDEKLMARIGRRVVLGKAAAAGTVAVLVALVLAALVRFAGEPSNSTARLSERNTLSLVDTAAHPDPTSPARDTVETPRTRSSSEEANRAMRRDTNRPAPVVATRSETPRRVVKPKMGCLRVLTRPPAARVYVDDIFRGTTPLDTIPVALSAGNHAVKISKEGYRKVVMEIAVRPDDTVLHRIPLLRIESEQ